MALNIGRGRTVKPTKDQRDFYTVDLKRKANDEDDTLAQFGLLALYQLERIEENLDAIANALEAKPEDPETLATAQKLLQNIRSAITQ